MADVLYRAGELCRAVFLEFRRRTFDLSIDMVSFNHNKIDVHTENGELETVFVTFPVDKIPKSVDHHALLAYHAGEDALIYMHELLKAVLFDVTVSVDEVTLRMVAKKQRVVLNGEGAGKDKAGVPHAVLLATLANGNEYAIDLAGAQYGLSHPLMDWEHYEDEVVLTIEKITFLGPRVLMQTANMVQYYEDGHVLPILHQAEDAVFVGVAKARAAKHLNDAVGHWIDGREEEDWAATLQLPKEEHEAARDDLLSCARKELDDMVGFEPWLEGEAAAEMAAEEAARGEHSAEDPEKTGTHEQLEQDNAKLTIVGARQVEKGEQ